MSTNNISFKARLDTSHLVLNKDRWKNISQEFENLTKNYPNDVLELTNDKNLELFLDTRYEVGDAKLKYKTTQELMLMSDIEIAKKLKKIYKIFKKQENNYNLGREFLKNLGKKVDFIELKNFNEDAFWELLTDKTIKDKTTTIKNDSLLRNGCEYI